MKYLVTCDGSQNAHRAWDFLTKLAGQNDSVTVLIIAEHISLKKVLPAVLVEPQLQSESAKLQSTAEPVLQELYSLRDQFAIEVAEYYKRLCVEAAESIGLPQKNFNVVIAHGSDAREVICAKAIELGSEVILCGRHGSTTTQRETTSKDLNGGAHGVGLQPPAYWRLHVGSVADYLVKHAPCPVLVVQ
mmetsp:Transcript_10481/g.17134  ORF Transcript_10481/g.17134 Transcript_10481/m.17134 type:complete len:189 (-) Transcript_10481:316-882(-)